MPSNKQQQMKIQPKMQIQNKNINIIILITTEDTILLLVNKDKAEPTGSFPNSCLKIKPTVLNDVPPILNLSE